MDKVIKHINLIQQTKRWLSDFVIGLNLCPFARKVFEEDRVKYIVDETTDLQTLLTHLYDEVMYLRQHPETSTSIIIIPHLLEGFLDYLDFLHIAEQLLVEYGFEGEFQLASFHPQYEFGDESPDSLKHYTNRSPYPMIHILREAEVELAIEHYPKTDQIPERNKLTLEGLGEEYIRTFLKS